MIVTHSARTGDTIGKVFSSFSNMEVCCLFSLESPHRGDSNEYTQHTIISTKKKITCNYPKYNNVCSYEELKNEFEIAVVNGPSEFEPLRYYCTSLYYCICFDNKSLCIICKSYTMV